MDKVVVWDPGHGGRDPGSAYNSIVEKDIALHIVKEAAARLEGKYEGVKCILTRSADVYLELKQRTDKANQIKADVLISVHCNAGGGAGGFESFIYKGSTDPRTLALQAAMHTSIMSQLKPHGVIDRGLRRKDLHMCRESAMPAVLTENLFLDVASDAAKLKRPEVIEALIEGHVLGVAKYLGLQKKQGVRLFVSGKQVQDAVIIDGVTYAPVRAVAEALGKTVGWEGTKKRVNIK